MNMNQKLIFLHKHDKQPSVYVCIKGKINNDGKTEICCMFVCRYKLIFAKIFRK